MRHPIFLALLLLMLCGCHDPSPKAMYGVYGEEASFVSWMEGDSLAVLFVSPFMLASYAEETGLDEVQALQNLCGLSSEMVMEGTASSFALLRNLSGALVVATQDVEGKDVDDQMRLQALARGAKDLRKTSLADTLTSITGLADPFSFLESVTQVLVLDLTDLVSLDEHTDWEYLKAYLESYIEEVKRFQRRSF